VAKQQPVPPSSLSQPSLDARAAAGDADRQLAESKALLASEIAGRDLAEAARIRLLRRLVVIQEEERRRIARDLHDDLGQRLTALRLALEADAREQAERRPAIERALTMLAGIDQGLDFIAWELTPAALEELGLARVLDTYVQEWSRHAAVVATFHSGFGEAERFAPEVEASVYRITQEALNNVAKHAHARSVNVLLEQRNEAIVLVVEDDGVGIQSGSESNRAMGLSGMRERAEAVGGSLEIEPTPEGGTTVLARIPLVAPAAGRPEQVRQGRGASGHTDASTAVNMSSASDGAPLTTMRGRLQELQEAVAARDEFIATVAHELRNPIAPLMFQVRLAIEKSEQIVAAGGAVPAEWVQSQLRRVEQRMHRLLETLDRLLDVSRLSTGRIDLQLEPTNLAVVAREVIGTLEAELAVARCELRFSEQGDPVGLWDRLRLEQICRNLLSNAIRFGAGQPIDVAVTADDDAVTLEVRDHGVGIAPQQQARIFERFERGAAQRSGGFGIGLWIVRNTCVAMGGTVSVASEPGEGACFTVRLPRRNDRGRTATERSDVIDR